MPYFSRSSGAAVQSGDERVVPLHTDAIVEALQASGWRGAIVGPHGSGKSTLLATLVPAIEQMGICVRQTMLRDGQRNLPAVIWREIYKRAADDSAASKKTCRVPQCLLVVDGYEQLGWWARRRLSAHCRRNHCGLLVTAHDDSKVGGIGILFRTGADLATVQHLVDHVLPPHGGVIHSGDVAAAFSAHAGNVRETLFALYDLFEQRKASR
jgi:hypothetical protein